MNETGDKLNAAYRALAREEPGAAIDAAILAASRRALEKPSASRRWAAPVSIAAVLVLAFGVTLRMQQEKPGVESPDVYSSPPAAAKVVPSASAPSSPAPQMQDAAPQRALPDARPQKEKKVVVPAAKPDFVPAPPQAKLQAAPAQPQAFEEDARQRRDESRVDNEQKGMLQKDNANVREAPAFAPKPAAPAASANTASVAATPPPTAGAAAAPASSRPICRRRSTRPRASSKRSRSCAWRDARRKPTRRSRSSAASARTIAFPTPCGSA
jgi:outer membrane biosynthesis protein TonB